MHKDNTRNHLHVHGDNMCVLVGHVEKRPRTRRDSQSRGNTNSIFSLNSRKSKAKKDIDFNPLKFPKLVQAQVQPKIHKNMDLQNWKKKDSSSFSPNH